MCVQFIEECSVYRNDTMSTSGDIMSTSEGGGGYHDACGEQGDKSLSIYIENYDVLNIPRCTEHPPMYS